MFRRRVYAVLATAGIAAVPACHHVATLCGPDGESVCREPVASSKEASLEAIACDLDCIEKHIDTWGSVTTKHPDVWGAARMTKYQQEVEKIFLAESTVENVERQVNQFQGSRARSDQAFLAQALSLNMALSGRQAASLDPLPVATTTGSVQTFNKDVTEGTNRNKNVTTSTADKSSGFANSTSDVQNAKTTTTTTPPTKTTTTTAASRNAALTFDPATGKLTRRVTEIPAETVVVSADGKTFTTFSADGTTKSTKTTNDDGSTKTTTEKVSGPDLTQALKSGVDGSTTTTTATPKAVEVPKDNVDDFIKTVSSANVTQTDVRMPALIGFGTDGLRLEPSVILDEKKRFLDHLNEIRRVNEGDDTSDSPGYALYMVRVPVSVLPGKRTDKGHGAEIMMSIKPILGDELLPSTFRNLVTNDMVDQFSELMVVALNDPDSRVMLKEMIADPAGADWSDAQRRSFDRVVAQVKPRLSSPRPSRHAEYAYPMNNLFELFGRTYVKALVLAAADRYKDELVNNRVVHLHDVRATVREQVVAAYRFIATGNPQMWTACNADLARAIRDLNGSPSTEHAAVLHQYRQNFDTTLGKELVKDAAGTIAPITHAASDRLVFEALAWGVMIESALLNEQLIRDMKESMTAKGVTPLAEGWLDYFHPTPSPQARQAFQAYVECRWPMYTFAVDPVIEQQNIQDTLSQRREMQLALSLSFASGNMSARSFTRFARRLEADYQTIDLNRTVVGFSHGDNTFGWRFYPRFQTPEIPGNLTVLTRDLIGGKAFNKDQELRERALEPGQRECVALVIMPSFVPNAEINISSHWFSLANPKHKNCSTQETVKLSRMVRSVELCNAKCTTDKYRPGEYNRLQSKAQMLSARLPLQDMKFQVPFENTLGGFEFFNSGVTDLTPQLRGWYGAAGYDPTREVELFLMGDNFSVSNTSIIAGGVQVPREFVRLLSRQVLSVKLPPNLVASDSTKGLYSESGKFIDIRLATPYGIGGPIRLPVLAAPPPMAPALASCDTPVVFLDRDTDIALQGANFTPDLQVFIGGKACATVVLSPTAAKATVPAGLKVTGADPAVMDLKVAGSAGISNPLAVSVFPAPVPEPGRPSIEAPGTPKIYLDRETEIVLKGTNFTRDMVVIAGGKACAVTVLGPTAAKIVVPKALTPLPPQNRAVELKAVSPGGVSDSIFVDVAAAGAKDIKAVLTSNQLEIGFRYKNIGIEASAPPNLRPEVRVKITDTPLKPFNGTADVVFESDAVNFTVAATFKNNVSEDLAAGIFKAVMEQSTSRFGPENVNPVAEIALSAKVTTADKTTRPIADGLTVKWIKVANVTTTVAK